MFLYVVSLSYLSNQSDESFPKVKIKKLWRVSTGDPIYYWEPLWLGKWYVVCLGFVTHKMSPQTCKGNFKPSKTWTSYDRIVYAKLTINLEFFLWNLIKIIQYGSKFHPNPNPQIVLQIQMGLETIFLKVFVHASESAIL